MVDIKEANWSKIISVVNEYAFAHVPRTKMSDLISATDGWKLIAQWLEKQHMSESTVRAAVDVGCGIGIGAAYIKRLTGANVTCFDKDPCMPAAPMAAEFKYDAVATDDIEHLASAKAFEPAANLFDAVLFIDVLQYMRANPVPVIKLLAKMTTQTGVVYLSCPDSDSVGKNYHYVTSYNELPVKPPVTSNIPEGVIWQYSKAEVTEIVAQCNLVVRRFGYTTNSLGRYLNFAIMR